MFTFNKRIIISLVALFLVVLYLLGCSPKEKSQVVAKSNLKKETKELQSLKVSKEDKTIIPILAYHHIKRNPDNFIAISPEMFEKHLKYLKENGYTTITLDALYNYITKNKPLPEKPVILTFDDGNRNVYLNAVPLLKKYNFKATFFIYPLVIHPKGRSFMSISELKELHKLGFDVQSHTWSHPYLTKRGRNESRKAYINRIKKELVKSKNWLETTLNKRVEYLAYPFGVYNTEVEKMVLDAGYKLALTIDEGVNIKSTPVTRIKRQIIFKKDTYKNFVDKVTTLPLFVLNLTPKDGEIIYINNPSVSATLQTTKDLNLKTIKMEIDLKEVDIYYNNVTKKISLSKSMQFKKGFHYVTIKARDKNNRLCEASWGFIVKGGGK